MLFTVASKGKWQFILMKIARGCCGWWGWKGGLVHALNGVNEGAIRCKLPQAISILKRSFCRGHEEWGMDEMKRLYHPVLDRKRKVKLRRSWWTLSFYGMPSRWVKYRQNELSFYLGLFKRNTNNSSPWM